MASLLSQLKEQMLANALDPVKTTVSDGEVVTNQELAGMVQLIKLVHELEKEEAAEAAANAPGCYAPVTLSPGY